MSINEFDRAVAFLQGALNAAAPKIKEESQTAKPVTTKTPVPDDPHADEPCLPGFDPEALPFDEPPNEVRTPTDTHQEPTAAAVTPPPQDPSPDPTADSGSRPVRGTGFGPLAVCAVLAACAGASVVAAHKLIRPRTVVRVVEKEVQAEPDGIPLSLLPETAEADVWETVANMSGEINGTRVCFKRGIALADGNDYRVCLDFCRSGNDIYAKVEGNGCWVVKVATNGQIQKAYRAQRGGKPLRTLFGK